MLSSGLQGSFTDISPQLYVHPEDNAVPKPISTQAALCRDPHKNGPNVDVPLKLLVSVSLSSAECYCDIFSDGNSRT